MIDAQDGDASYGAPPFRDKRTGEGDMCITFEAAELSNTKLYAGEAQRGDRYVHVIAYQNKAATKGPNAMILPLPAAVMPGPENVIDTRGLARFLEDIHRATEIVAPPTKNASRSLGALEEAQVFDVGSYTVVLAASPLAIPEALASVSPDKRPPVNPGVLRAFEELYPGWPLAVCCWNGTFETEPLLWWYEPKMPDQLFAPALDAHDGQAPRTGANVRVDHHVAFGSTLRPVGKEVRYRDDVYIPDGRSAPSWLAPYESASREVPPPRPVASTGLLPPRVRGTRLKGKMPNGDFWLSTATLSGPAERRAPGAAKGVPVPLDGWKR